MVNKDPGDPLIGEIDKLRGLLLWCLYHHQGADSDVGQSMRKALGIGQYDRLTDEQLAIARTVTGVTSVQQGDN